MFPVLLSLTVLTPLDSAAGVAAAPGPAEQRKKNEEFYAGRSKLARRENGAKLTVEVKVATPKGKPDQIEFHWTLDYTGPRQPFIILAPTLERATSKQTGAIFYAEGQDGRPYEYEVTTPLASVWELSTEDHYVKADKGKSASGVTRVSVEVIRAHYLKHWPNQFAVAPPVVHVQLWHQPHERGTFQDEPLDAWTGKLYAPVLKIELKRW